MSHGVVKYSTGNTVSNMYGAGGGGLEISGKPRCKVSDSLTTILYN